jgi:hypothetical protein
MGGVTPLEVISRRLVKFVLDDLVVVHKLIPFLVVVTCPIMVLEVLEIPLDYFIQNVRVEVLKILLQICWELKCCNLLLFLFSIFLGQLQLFFGWDWLVLVDHIVEQIIKTVLAKVALVSLLPLDQLGFLFKAGQLLPKVTSVSHAFEE